MQRICIYFVVILLIFAKVNCKCRYFYERNGDASFVLEKNRNFGKCSISTL